MSSAFVKSIIWVGYKCAQTDGQARTDRQTDVADIACFNHPGIMCVFYICIPSNSC